MPAAAATAAAATAAATAAAATAAAEPRARRAPGDPAEFDRRVARWAGRHHGLITRGQALAYAGTDRRIAHRVRSGRWRRVSRGVYAVAGAPETFEQRALAACLAAGPDALLSYRTAGAIWGLPGCDGARRRDAPVEVLVAHDGHGGHRMAGVRLHRSRRLSSKDRAVVGSLPVTTVSRTLVDLAMPPETEHQLADRVDDAVCRQVVTVDRLSRRAAAVCGRGRPGTRRMRAVLATWTAPRRAPASAPEARLARWMRSEGLGGEPEHGVVAGGVRCRLDWAWPDARFGLELDSFRWHGAPGRYRASLERAARLRAEGWEIHGVTPQQVDQRDPAVLAAIGRVLAERRRYIRYAR